VSFTDIITVTRQLWLVRDSIVMRTLTPIVMWSTAAVLGVYAGRLAEPGLARARDVVTVPTTSPTPPVNGWCSRTEKRLLELQNTTSALHELEATLVASGVRLDEPLKSDIAWTKAILRDLFERKRLRAKIRKQLIELWFITFNGSPVINAEPGALCDSADKIAKGYRDWLSEHAQQSEEDVVRLSLKGNIESVNSQYAWVAVHVLRKHLALRDNSIETHGADDFRAVTKESRRTAYQAFAALRRSYGDKLSWDSLTNKLVGHDGESLPIAEFELDWAGDPRP